MHACFCQQPWLEYQLKVLTREGDFKGAMVYEAPWVEEESGQAIVEGFEPETYNRTNRNIHCIRVHFCLKMLERERGREREKERERERDDLEQNLRI